MADKSIPLVLTALSRAAAAGGPIPLFGSKTVAGLFPTTAPGKQAAQRCRDEGYLTVVPEEPAPTSATDSATATLTRKKSSSQTLCLITDKGLAYLLSQVSPREVLEEFVRVLQARGAQWSELNALAQRLLHSTETLKTHVEKVLSQFPRPEGPGAAGNLKALFRDFLNDAPLPAAGKGLEPLLLEELGGWQGTGSGEDCPLPDLYRKAKARTPALTIGQFHDALRRLSDDGKIYLHPWSGPLYDLPEPPYALLTGHEVAYYASVRQ